MKNKKENITKNESKNIKKKKCKSNILSLVKGFKSLIASEMSKNEYQKKYEYSHTIEKINSKHLPERLIQLIKEKWVLYGGYYISANDFSLLFKKKQSIKGSNTIQNKENKKLSLSKLQLERLNMLLNNFTNEGDYKAASEIRDIINMRIKQKK
jgi:protein-arginine kinase activator protein McsA